MPAGLVFVVSGMLVVLAGARLACRRHDRRADRLGRRLDRSYPRFGHDIPAGADHRPLRGSTADGATWSVCLTM